MRAAYQTTLAERVDLMGRGVHCGAQSRVSLLPAGPDTGIVFVNPNPYCEPCLDYS